MLAPALPYISRDLDIDEAGTQSTLSIFVLAFAFGPMVLGPLSEVFGRRPVFLWPTIWYLIWNIVCGLAHNKAIMVTGRFFGGLGASASFPVSVLLCSTASANL